MLIPLDATPWTVRHLKKVGIAKDLLVRIYCKLIRPIFEYASPAFHTVLTEEQSERLEKMQRSTLKTIFGMDCPYEQCLEKAGIPTLKDRREDLFRKFTLKAFASDKYRQRWFTDKRRSGYGLRREGIVEEQFASRERLQRAPIYRMRKLINELEA